MESDCRISVMDRKTKQNISWIAQCLWWNYRLHQKASLCTDPDLCCMEEGEDQEFRLFRFKTLASAAPRCAQLVYRVCKRVRV